MLNKIVNSELAATLFDFMRKRLNDSCFMKNYLVIGGSSGIGREIVSQLSLEGNRVFATYHTNKNYEEFQNTTYHQYEVGVSELNFIIRII